MVNLLRNVFGTFAPDTSQFGEMGLTYDPRAAQKAAVGGVLKGLGVGLASQDWGRAAEIAGSGVEDYQAQQARKAQMQDLMFRADENRRKREEEAKRTQQMEEAISQLPADQQALARMMPEKFFGNQIDAQFSPGLAPNDRYKAVGNNLYDVETGQWVQGPDGASSEPPTVKTIYDQESGQEQAVQWTGTGWEPLGGPKAKGDQRSSATELKQLWSSEDEIPVLDSTIDSLNRALELNKKTFTGATAGMRGWAGTAIPGAAYLMDPEAAKATREFGQIMSMEAIKSMSETLKGATTDRELAQFVEILADPSTPPPIRERTIKRMLSLAERMRQLKMKRVDELRGSTAVSPTAPANEGVPDGLTAEEWNAMTPEDRALWQ